MIKTLDMRYQNECTAACRKTFHSILRASLVSRLLIYKCAVKLTWCIDPYICSYSPSMALRRNVMFPFMFSQLPLVLFTPHSTNASSSSSHESLILSASMFYEQFGIESIRIAVVVITRCGERDTEWGRVMGHKMVYQNDVMVSEAAVSLIDLLQIARQDSVIGDSSHQRESLIAASSHQMNVVLEIPQAMPLWDLIYVSGFLERTDKERKKICNELAMLRSFLLILHNTIYVQFSISSN